MARVLKVLTLNVNGLGSMLKRYRLSRFTKQQNIDIACLQETHKAKKDKKPLINDPGWEVIEARGTAKARGVAIMLHRKNDYKITEVISDREGRYLLVKCLFENKVMTVVNIYAPNKGQRKFILNILKKMQKFAEGEVIMAGDFNKDLNKEKIVNWKQWNLIESHEALKQTPKTTHFSSRHKTASCLDYIVVKRWSSWELKKIITHPIWISDHAPVIAEMEMDYKQVKKTWRYNDRVMSKQEDNQYIRDQLRMYFKENRGTVTVETLWDAGKAVIRGYCIMKEKEIKNNGIRKGKKNFWK